MSNSNSGPVISLISPPTRSNSRQVPNALICLAAWLDREGISNNIIDQKIQRDSFVPLVMRDIEHVSDQIVEKVLSFNPALVGLPCYTSEYTAVMSLAKRIKKKSGAKIIIGGLHAALKCEDFLFEGSPIDFAVIGEGEISLTELIKAYLAGLPLNDIQGIAFRNSGSLVKTAARERIADLKVLPLPAYYKIDMDYYLKPDRYIIRLLLLSGVHIFTTRGCPNQCTFCANRMRQVTYRPLQDVVEEIKFLKQNYGIDSFYIADDTFCLKKERVYEFIQLINDLPYKFVWAMETTVRSVDEQMVRALKKSGCIQIDFGVESGSQDALNRMKKGITVEQIENAFRLCRKHGMRTFPTLMFNTPEETESDVAQTISLMKRIRATNYGLNLTVPFFGTEIYEKYVTPKLSKEDYHVYSDPELFHTISDSRFRLAKHNLNLDKLYIESILKYGFFRKIFDTTLNMSYWMVLSRSRYKKDYLIFVFRNFKRQVKVFCHYLSRLIFIKGK